MEILNKISDTKFSHPEITAKGERRAHVPFVQLDTLWLNTGTLCNLQCANCYIESSPKNDRLVYLTHQDCVSYLEEIEAKQFKTQLIGITGGEPFMNPDIHKIIDEVLSRGLEILVLTNATKFLKKHFEKIASYAQNYPHKFHLRVSLDHHSQEVHESERGDGTFIQTMTNLKWLFENKVRVSIAGRSLIHEDMNTCEQGYLSSFKKWNIPVDELKAGENLLIFPEMKPNDDVPEITTQCWSLLDKKPTSLMCSNERMVVKRKGEDKPKVLACTLLAYDEKFELGHTLEESFKSVSLNHPYCASFCVLGGGSCSSVK